MSDNGYSGPLITVQAFADVSDYIRLVNAEIHLLKWHFNCSSIAGRSNLSVCTWSQE
jgi:hypothetical protein